MNKNGISNLLLVVAIVAVFGLCLVFSQPGQDTAPLLVSDGESATSTPDSVVPDGAAPISTSTTIAPAQIPKPPVQSASPKNISKAHNAFGINAIKILAKDDVNKNVFISPTSIALALSMVYNGAAGQTKTAMQQTLQFQGLDISTINKESLGLANLLKNPDVGVELSIANSVWARTGFDFKKTFLDTVSSYFSAKISTLDFSKPTAAGVINAWVSANTKGKIPSIVESPISNNVVMYLINAVYFKGNWTDAFDKKLTENKTFTNSLGVAGQHPLMQRHAHFAYLETDDFQSVSLPYGKNKRLSMHVFLPKDLSAFVKNLDETTWNTWMNQYSSTKGTLLLPKFKMEYSKGLVPMLKELGMGIAFTDSADLSSMGKGLFISNVAHKTYVDVNEEGTEAAAVTSVEVGVTSAPIDPPKTFYMEVNRPFFVAIRDSQTQEILFIGMVQNP